LPRGQARGSEGGEGWPGDFYLEGRKGTGRGRVVPSREAAAVTPRLLVRLLFRLLTRPDQFPSAQALRCVERQLAFLYARKGSRVSVCRKSGIFRHRVTAGNAAMCDVRRNRSAAIPLPHLPPRPNSPPFLLNLTTMPTA
jgi:hypothetical protein